MFATVVTQGSVPVWTLSSVQLWKRVVKCASLLVDIKAAAHMKGKLRLVASQLAYSHASGRASKLTLTQLSWHILLSACSTAVMQLYMKVLTHAGQTALMKTLLLVGSQAQKHVKTKAELQR
jgi:hypothetical protein